MTNPFLKFITLTIAVSFVVAGVASRAASADEPVPATDPDIEKVCAPFLKYSRSQYHGCRATMNLQQSERYTMAAQITGAGALGLGGFLVWTLLKAGGVRGGLVIPTKLLKALNQKGDGLQASAEKIEHQRVAAKGTEKPSPLAATTAPSESRPESARQAI